MSADYNIELAGLQETVIHLKTYEPLLLLILQREAQNKFRPVAKAVAKEFPRYSDTLPNWNGEGRYNKVKGKKGGSFPKYSGDATTAVDIVTPNKTSKGFARVQQMSASGSVFDSAKKSTNKTFVGRLDMATGGMAKGSKSRSRIMFPKTIHNLPLIEKQVEEVTQMLNVQIQRKLGGAL